MKILFLLSIFFHMQQTLPERQLLIFYTESGKAMLEKQKKEWHSQQAGLKERDITVKEYPVGTTEATVLKTWKIDKSSPFTCILVGKDGGEKFRTTEILTAEKLFAIIDAMPMRRSESRRSE